MPSRMIPPKLQPLREQTRDSPSLVSAAWQRGQARIGSSFLIVSTIR